ncbi:MAG: MarR family winged helix-turn-helix transcriptional regulator [Sciscionella sp.]
MSRRNLDVDHTSGTRDTGGTGQLTEALGARPDPATSEFHEYFGGIAEAHYVIRKVFRLVDEQAKKAGMEPLEHKLLIQIFGAPDAPLSMQGAARRLDISPALASRMVTRLVGRGLVRRTSESGDRRVTRVAVTDSGREVLARVDRDVRRHVDLFQYELGDSEREGALRTFAFYLGGR